MTQHGQNEISFLRKLLKIISNNRKQEKCENKFEK